METIDIKRLSNRSLAKMKQGKPFRITKGTGLSLSVHSSRLPTIMRKFQQNKGHELSLSPQEINMNMNHSANGAGLYAGDDGNGLYAGDDGNGLYAGGDGTGFKHHPPSRLPTGSGLYAGNGLVRSAIDDIERLGTIIKKHNKSSEISSIKDSKIIGYGINTLPPALQSQPFAENYQWNYTISPIYHK